MVRFHTIRRGLILTGWFAAELALLVGLPTTAKADPVEVPVEVIAHRGGAMNRSENTLPAFRHAAEIGAQWLEFDMLMTADDRIAVYHDAEINPAFCAPDKDAAIQAGPVRGLTFAELRQFDCGAGVRPAYAVPGHVRAPGARIPSLDEVLAGFKDSDARFFAETKFPKPTPGLPDIDPVKFASMLDEAVRKHGLEDRLVLQSFDFRTIDAMHRINPRIRTCLLGAPKLTRDYAALLGRHHASCIVLGAAAVDRNGVAALRKAGVLVFSDVVDTPAEWRTYVDLGMSAIFTNDPASALEFLEKAEPKL